MADARRVIELVFQGVDETSGALSSVGGGLDKFASGLTNTLTPLTNVADKLLEFDAVIGGLAVGIGTLVGKLTGDFDQSFREISTLLADGTKDVGGFRQSILDFGSDAVFSFKQTTNAVYEALSSNIAYGDSVQFVNTAQQLAIGTLGDLDNTTKLVINTLNGYNLSIDQASHVSDVLFETVKIGQVRIAELAESMGRVTPIAHVAGLSLEELGAAMSVLTLSGLNADESATALRALLSDLIKITPQAALEAKALGLDFSLTALHAKGLVGFLQDVQEKTGGNVVSLGKLIPNVRGLTAELILGQDGAHKLAGAMDEFGKIQGVAAQAAEKTAGSINLLAQRMLNAAEAVAIQFGLPLIDNIGNIEKSVVSLFHALQDAVKNGLGDTVLTFIASILQSIEDFITRLAVILPEALKAVDPSPIIEGLKKIAAAFLELFGNVDITTTEGLAQAIQLVVDTMGTLETVTAGLITGLKPLVDTFLAWAKNTNNLPEQTKFLAGELLGLAKTASEFVPVVSRLSDVLSGLAAVIGGGALLANVGTLTLALSNPVTACLVLVAALGLGVGAYELFGKGSLDAANAVSNVGNSAKTAATDGLGPLAGHAAEAADAHSALSAHAETSNDAIRKLIDSSHLATVGLQEHQGQVKDTADEYEKGQGKIDAAALRLIEFGKTLGHDIPWSEASDQAKEGFDVVTQAVKTYDEATGEVVTHSTQMIVNLNNTGDSAEKAADKTSKSAEKMALDWAKLDVEWEKIASQEREVVFKATAEIAVAQIQAQAEQVKAAFESINTAIESTGSTLSSLAQTFAGAQGGLGSTDLKRILDDENARRSKAFDLQEKLVNAQVEYLQNLNSRLDDGSALINISSDGLEPELEAFMFKILERVQIEASRQGQSFLLGLPQG